MPAGTTDYPRLFAEHATKKKTAVMGHFVGEVTPTLTHMLDVILGILSRLELAGWGGGGGVERRGAWQRRAASGKKNLDNTMLSSRRNQASS